MHTRQLCLCLTVLTSTAACGDDGGGATDEPGTSGSATESSTGDPTPTTSGASEPGTSEGSGTGEGSSTGEPIDNPFPAGGCGLPEYPILPATDMGEVLDHAFVIHFDADTIDGLLEAQNFGALTPVAYGADVYKIRYRTQDRGEAVEATGFVSYPTGDAVGERPVVVWAHGTSGFTDKCGPTAAADGYVVPALLAALGFVTVAPDYLGMNGWGAPSGFIHPYIVPEPTAIATLDPRPGPPPLAASARPSR